MISENKIIAIKASAACLLWSTAFAGAKIALYYTTPLFLAGVRFFLAGIFLIPFSGHVKDYFSILRQNIKLVLSVAALQTVIMYGLYFSGIDFIPASIAALIIGASPLITAIVTHIYLQDDKLSGRKLVSIIISITGIILIVIGRQTMKFAGLIDIVGILLLVISMIVSAFANILVSRHKGQISPILLNSYQLGIGGIVLMVISLPVEGIPVFDWDLTFIIALLWLSILSAVAFSIWFSLLKKPGVKVSELNMWKFLIPVFGAVLSWLLLPNEYPTLISLLGMVIIAGSILFYYLPGKNIEGRELEYLNLRPPLFKKLK